MGKTQHNYIIRLEAKGGKVVASELQNVGNTGERSFRRINEAAVKTKGKISLLSGAVGRLAVAFGAYRMARSVIDNIQAFEKIDNRLKNLTDSTDEYARSQEFLKKAARDLNTDLLILSDGYAKLLALKKGGILSENEVQELLVGLTDAKAALGGSDTQLGQVLYGLSQALSQGRVQAQEFNQIIEPLPGLMQAMDKAARVSAGGFREMIKEGKVTSDVLKNVLIRALDEYEGASKDLDGTMTASLANLKTSWQEFVKALAETPLVDMAVFDLQIATSAMTGFTGVINHANDELSVMLKHLRTLSEFDWFVQKAKILTGIGPQYTSVPENVLSQNNDTASQRGLAQFQAELQTMMDEVAALSQNAAEAVLEHGSLVGKNAPTPGKKPQAIYDRALKEQDEAIAKAEKEAKAINDLIESLKFRNEQLNRTAEEQELYNQLQAAGISLTSEEGQKIKGLVDEYQALTKAQEAAEKQAEKLKNAANSIGDAFSNAFEEAIIGGKSFNDVLDSLGDTILRTLYNDLIGSQISSTVSSFASNILPSLFGGYRAEGGPIEQGKWYIAGEHGPEPIWGGGAGSFAVGYNQVTASSSNNGGSPQVNMSVNMIDQTSQGVNAQATLSNGGRSIDIVLTEKINKALKSGALDTGMKSRYGAMPTRTGR